MANWKIEVLDIEGKNDLDITTYEVQASDIEDAFRKILLYIGEYLDFDSDEEEEEYKKYISNLDLKHPKDFEYELYDIFDERDQLYLHEFYRVSKVSCEDKVIYQPKSYVIKVE